MRAVIRRDGRLVVDQMAVPTPEAGQVLCRTLACGICGSDLHALDHYDHMIDLSAKMGGFGAMKKGADTVFGHEFCCEIIEQGPGTEGRFRPGTRVVSVPGVITPTGFETVGYSSRLPGGFAEHIVLTEAMLHEVPNGLSSEHAALTEPLAVGEHAVAMAAPEPEHVFLVIGCGPVGLAVIASLKARGLGPVIAADYSPERRAAAEIMGADKIVDPAQVSPHASFAEFGVPASRGEGLIAAAMGQTVKRPVIFECVGAPGVLQALAEGAPGGARIVVAGVCMETDRIDPLIFIGKEIELRFVLGYSADEFAASLANLAEGKTRYNQIITGVVGLDETPGAFVKLQSDKSQIKILVAPGPLTVQLQAYLDRIGFDGPARPDRATLEAVHRLHLLSIPYENLDVQLGRTLTTSPEAAFDKLVIRRRGGWCYEMNGLLGLALQTIGFTVTRMAGGVMRQTTGDEHVGSHLVLKVDLPEGPMIADVGFGDGPISPFPLKAGPFSAGAFDFRLETVEDGWWRLHNHPLGGAPSFDFQPKSADEAMLSERCVFLQTAAVSPFVQNLVAQIHTGDGLALLRGRILRRVGAAGVHDHLIGGPGELLTVLKDVFGLDVPEAAGLWDRIVSRHHEVFGASAPA